MKLEWDFSELMEFADRLSEYPRFEKEMKKACKDIAKEMLKWIKTYTPVETYTLINGWNGNKFLVTNYEEGFEVLLVNTTPYAFAVNNGHKAYNQYGGPYPIKPYNPRGAWGKPEGRIQVRTPHKWQNGNPTYYVFGHFFVERGIVRTANTELVENILMKQLTKWWEGCLNG